MLILSQASALSLRAPPPVLCAAYDGPSNGKLEDLAISLPHPTLGIVLEVAQSLVADGKAGRGLFIRASGDPVTISGGTALCGYGSGEMSHDQPARARGRATEFKLVGCAPVWFEGELTNACELLLRDGIDGILGHEARRDANGNLLSLQSCDGYAGPRFFVPSEQAVEGSALDFDSVGIMANDLAAGAKSAAAYDAEAGSLNVLCLVQELKRDERALSTLLPSGPVPTLARTITFANREPMELGIAYGSGFWQGNEW